MNREYVLFIYLLFIYLFIQEDKYFWLVGWLYFVVYQHLRVI